jgi:tRNA(fMet)-specific endonuclease VapC
VSLFLLDTDICSYVMKRSHPALLTKLRNTDLERIAISVVTEAELLYGIELSANPKLVRSAFDGFMEHVRVLEWGRSQAGHYAEIRAYLHKRGEMIGANDLLIAAHGRSLGATIVTNNEKEFRRVHGLKVENWST